MSGSAVRSFDTLEDAKQAYEEAMAAGMVYEVTVTGARRVLTEENVEAIPGMNGNHIIDCLTTFSIRLKPRNLTVIHSPESGIRCMWGPSQASTQARKSLLSLLAKGHVC